MISPVSFGSTFKVTTTSNQKEMKSFNKFNDFCQAQGFEKVKTDDSFGANGKKWSATTTLVVDDDNDGFVEAFCRASGIKYSKSLPQDNSVKSISKRVEIDLTLLS